MYVFDNTGKGITVFVTEKCFLLVCVLKGDYVEYPGKEVKKVCICMGSIHVGNVCGWYIHRL